MVDIKNIKFVLVDKYSKENVFPDLSEIKNPNPYHNPNPSAQIYDYCKASSMEDIKRAIVKQTNPDDDSENSQRVIDFLGSVEMKNDLENYEKTTTPLFSLPIYLLQQGSLKLFNLAIHWIEFKSEMLFHLNADQLRLSIIQRLLDEKDGPKFLNYFLTLDFGPLFSPHFIESQKEKKEVMSYLMKKYDLNYIDAKNNNSLHNALLNTRFDGYVEKLNSNTLRMVIYFLQIEKIDLKLFNEDHYTPEELYLKQIFITKKRIIDWDDFYVKIPSSYDNRPRFDTDIMADDIDTLYPNIFTFVITKSLKEHLTLGVSGVFFNNYVRKYIFSEKNVVLKNHEQLILLIKKYKEKFEEATYTALLSKLELQKPENPAKRQKQDHAILENPPPPTDSADKDPSPKVRKIEEPMMEHQARIIQNKFFKQPASFSSWY